MSEELQDREEDAVQPTLEAMDLQQLEDSWQPTRTPVHYLAGFLLLGVVVAYLLTQSLPPGYNLLDMLYQ